MKAKYEVYDGFYKEARARGWAGWGGDERMAHEHIWFERLFSYAGVPIKGKALELGCGEGHYARHLAEKGYDVTGVDISATAIEWAKEKTLAAGLEVDFLELDLTKPGVMPGKAFDLIADGNCLHCIIGEDRQVFLANVHRLLTEDGLFFVYSRCSEMTADEVVELDSKPYRFGPSRENLRQELEAAGFAIQQFNFHRREFGAHSHCTLHLTRL